MDIKNDLTRVDRKSDEKEYKFLEQVSCLLVACRNYDEGFHFAALNIATILRTLFIDKGGLLKKIDSKIQMYDTSQKMSSTFGLGLIGIRSQITRDDGLQHDFGSMRYEQFYAPLCDSLMGSKGEERMTNSPRLIIDKWQKERICINKKFPEDSITRWDLIDIAANQDGGSHIDERICKKYDNYRYTYSGLSEEHVLKMKNAGQEILNIPVYAMLRQVAYEVLYSMQKAKLIREDQELTFNWHIEAVKNSIGALSLENKSSILNWGEYLRIFGPENIGHSHTQTYYQRHMKDHQKSMESLRNNIAALKNT